ncbi:MAG TPA: Rrf2 family transcriptional regulator [Gemmataceae bacterium]|nr:Rrf2 family transcriptional regulator [Gemmataceae bacterium]
MKISRKADYALRVLFTLIDQRGAGPLSMTQLAQQNDVPKKFLEHIMLGLKEQGWVESSPGRFGGYALTVSPERITMGQVIRRFGGLIAPIGCVSVTQNLVCTQSHRCRFRRVFLDVRNLTARYLDNLTLASVAGMEPVDEREVFALELVAGDGI